MKNIYELDAKDRKKYKDEYSDLPFIKKHKYPKLICMIVFFLSGFACATLESIMDEGTTANFEELLNFLYDAASIAFYILIFILIIEAIAFVRWLKIKHKIEY